MRGRIARSPTSKRRTSPRWCAWRSCVASASRRRTPATRSTPPSMDGCRPPPTTRCASASSTTPVAMAGAAPPTGWNSPAPRLPDGSKRCSTSTAGRQPAARASSSRSPRNRRRYSSRARASRPSNGQGMSWAKRRSNELALGPEPKSATEIVARGDVVYVVHEKEGGPASSAQLPEAESALVALDPNDGAILSLVGGFDYFGRPGQVQPRDAGAAPARVGIQAIHVRRGSRREFHAGIGDPRCTHHHGRSEPRGGVAAGEFRRRLRRARRGCAKRWCARAISFRSGCCKEMGVRPVIDYVQHFGFSARADCQTT